MPNVSFGNVMIYSAQVFVVVVSAAMGAHFIAAAAPRPRLAFWRTVIVTCRVQKLRHAARTYS